MPNRKYINFILETEEDSFECQDWKVVFGSYQREESATIYGLPNYDGANYEMIISK